MYEEQLKHYLDDLSPNVDLIGEAIASLEGYFEYISEFELLHFRRSEAIAYLALKQIVRCKDCKNHGTDCCEMEDGFRNPTPDDWFCSQGERK